MPWARIDDGFDDHPKVLALLEHDDGAAAIGLWTLCLTWAHRNTRKKDKTPGLVPDSLPRRYLGVLGRSAAKLLAEAGLWEETEGGWQIHDFDKYLPTSETSAARSEAGKRGADARWSKRRGDGKLPSGAMANDGTRMAADGDTSPFGGDDDDAGSPDGRGYDGDGNLPSPDSTEPSDDGKALASDGSRASARRAISKEIAPKPDPNPSSQTPSENSPSGSSARPAAKAIRGSRIPDDFAVTAEMTEWARKEVPNLLAAGKGRVEQAKFIDHWHQASGANARKVDWVAAWRNWMRRADDDLGRNGGNRGGASNGYRPSTTDQRVAQAQSVKAQLAGMNQGDEQQ